MEPCCVCSCSLVCDCVAYSGLQSLLSLLAAICFPLYFLPPGVNFILAGGNCICSYRGFNAVPHSVVAHFSHLSSVIYCFFLNISPTLICLLLLLCLLSSPARPCLFLKPCLSDAPHSFLPLYSILSSSPFLLSPLLSEARLSSCSAARREDTVMLSLLVWHNSTSLWGVKALTIPCLSVCAAPLSAPVNPHWLIGWYLSCCLPVCQTSCRGEWSSGCI